MKAICLSFFPNCFSIIHLRAKIASLVPMRDDIPAELIKNVSKNIYNTEEVLYDFYKCIMKAAAKKCGQYRTLSLILHVSRIHMEIILRRVEKSLRIY